MPAKKTHKRGARGSKKGKRDSKKDTKRDNAQETKNDNKNDNKQAEMDVSYTSKIWKRDLTATDVFINPTLETTCEGIIQLVKIASEGGDNFFDEHKVLRDQGDDADHDWHFVAHTNVYDLIAERKGQTVPTKVKKAQAALASKAKQFGEQLDRLREAFELVKELTVKFDQLENVAMRILTTKEELGDQITVDEMGRKKVAISAKCIDTIWKDILTTHGKLKRLQDEIAIVKALLPPITGRLKRTLVSGRVDADGNELGIQEMWCYDPDDVLTLAGDVNDTDLFSAPSELLAESSESDKTGDIGGLTRIEELAEDDAADSEATPVSGDDSTLVEEFEKVQITPIDPCLPGSTTPPGSPIRSNDESTHHGEAMTAVTKEQDIKQEGLKSDRKRKARDDSPEREETEDIKDKEVESDSDSDSDSDDLEFICE